MKSNSQDIKHKFINKLKVQGSELQKLRLPTNFNFDSNCGVISISPKGDILGVNDRFLEMWRIPDDQLTAKDLKKCQNYIVEQLEASQNFSELTWETPIDLQKQQTNLLRLKDGRVFAQSFSTQKLDGQLVARIYLIWDVTKFSLEKNLVEVINNERVPKLIQQNTSVKDLFLSMLCHKFRSLLNVVSFSNSMLKRRLLQQKNQQETKVFLNNIQAGVEEITQLLDELVFYGKLENGKIEFQPSLIEINLFCNDVVTQIRPLANSKQQTIDLVHCDNCQTVYSDQALLQPMLINLLSNAIKYSPENSTIILEFSCQDENLIFQIKDRGIGIPQSEIPKLFEAFFRGSNVSGIKGNGMGLAIVKNLVDLQGGKLDIVSEIGVGTNITVILPLIDS
ncbi:MAG TPA: sensor histidine kinase [Xenococcaceae cyanobacterium]